MTVFLSLTSPAARLDTLSDNDLLAGVQRLTARSNAVLADLLAYLGEVEERGIHRLRACASLYAFCMYELRMSEDAAFRRSKAARLVRRYPELHGCIARGELHLTAVLMIASYLGGERHGEVLQRARFRSKSEICRLIAELDPKPPVPALVEPIGPEAAGRATHAAQVEALAGPVRDLPPGRRPADWLDGETEHATIGTTDGSRSTVFPNDHPLRYRVQFTASQEFVDLLNEALDLLGHEAPRPDLPEVQLRALRALVEDLRTCKRAALRTGPGRSTAPARVIPDPVAAPPAPARDRTPDAGEPAPRGRHIPAPARRDVWTRDAARCAYVDDRGQRCCETRGLELHHRHAHALGGPSAVSNLELRCRAHNTLAAEEDFGRARMGTFRRVG